MKCPFYQHPNTQVTDSRLLEEINGIHRQRYYSECGRRFSTFEAVEIRMSRVAETNGARIAFNPYRLHTSLSRVLHERPVSPEMMGGTVALTKRYLYQLGHKEMPFRLVDEVAMEEPAKIGQVAYMRPTPVYESFSDVSGFTQAIATLSKDHPAEQVATCQGGI